MAQMVIDLISNHLILATQYRVRIHDMREADPIISIGEAVAPPP